MKLLCSIFCLFRGELSYYSLLEETSETEQNLKWKIFTTLSLEKSHKKIIYEINFYKDTIITISLDRLVKELNIFLILTIRILT